jgi:hypothetical protein
MQKEFPLEKPFSKVRCKDIGTLILTQGTQPSLVVEADEELFSELTAEIVGDSLVLGLDDDWISRIGKVFSSILNQTERRVVYHLTVADVDQVSISGKVNLACAAFAAENLVLKVSGLGKLDFSHLDCTSLEVIISGRGEFSAAGRADHQTIKISGSGEYDAAHLASQSARATISGQGNAALRVAETLEITISGVGQVNYIGRPKVRQVISGVGKSKRLNDG